MTSTMRTLPIRNADAHFGGLDANGCHYDTAGGPNNRHRTINPDLAVTAAARKPRAIIRHDAASPNYSTAECLARGGRAPR